MGGHLGRGRVAVRWVGDEQVPSVHANRSISSSSTIEPLAIGYRDLGVTLTYRMLLDRYLVFGEYASVASSTGQGRRFYEVVDGVIPHPQEMPTPGKMYRDLKALFGLKRHMTGAFRRLAWFSRRILVRNKHIPHRLTSNLAGASGGPLEQRRPDPSPVLFFSSA